MASANHIWLACVSDECREVYEIDRTDPRPVCPACGTPRDRDRNRSNYLTLRAELYGTDATPVYNEGLGEWTTGKTDWRRKARAKQLVPHDE